MNIDKAKVEDKPKPEVKAKPKFKSMRTLRKDIALELVRKIRAKMGSLRHGYIADEEFNELEELISKF